VSSFPLILLQALSTRLVSATILNATYVTETLFNKSPAGIEDYVNFESNNSNKTVYLSTPKSCVRDGNGILFFAITSLSRWQKKI